MSSNTGASTIELTSDPYLAYQPSFAYTLPVQLLVAGITFTLLVVLVIHLLFTTQYHYPLAPLNYCLQLFSIVSCLASVVIKIIVILDHSNDNAGLWPYDLDYIAVSIPSQTWSEGSEAAWFLLQAINNGLVNITHIQFLTLLFPSRTEARLIIFILGPLAITSSALFFVALAPSRTVLDLGDAIRKVFNSTLLLIFTLSLVMWGFVVNRRHAWRFDGGTAVFGCGSLFLAFVSTIGNFVAVKEEGIEWLQHLLWAAVLWQTWLGWWWWVGAGMGIGEVEDLIERAERKQRKAAARRAKRKFNGIGSSQQDGSGSSNGSRTRQSIIVDRVRSASTTASAAVANLVLSARRSDNSFASVSGRASGGLVGGEEDRRGSRLRFRGKDRDGIMLTDLEDGLGMDPELALDSGVELEDLAGHRRSSRARTSNDESPESGPSYQNGSNNHSQRHSVDALSNFPPIGNVGRDGTSMIHQNGDSGQEVAPLSSRRSSAPQVNPTNSTLSETSSTSRTPSLHVPRSFNQLFSFPATWVMVYMRRLRKAHEDATKVRALDHAERRSRVFASESAARGGGVAVGVGSGIGMGLGGGDGSRGGQIGGRFAGVGKSGGGGKGGGSRADGAGWGLGSFGVREHEESAKRLKEAERRMRAERLLSGGEEENGEDGQSSVQREEHEVCGTGGHEDDWEDVDGGTVSVDEGRVRRSTRQVEFRGLSRERGVGVSRNRVANAGRDGDGRAEEVRGEGQRDRGVGTGWSWWGPLKEWRLADRSVY